MPSFSANSDAMSNYREGRAAFMRGLRTAEDVYRAHLTWNRGTAADHHFAEGYREAAERAGLARADIDAALRYVRAVDTSHAETVRRLEILCDVQARVLRGIAPAQWQLDRAHARAASA